MSELVSIKDKIPPKHTPVLVYEDGHYYRAAWAGGDFWFSWCGQPVVYNPKPTHWMPLPEPPK